MKFQKIVKPLLALSVLAMVIALASCGGGSKTSSSSSGSSSSTASSGGSSDVRELPRKETLYFNGQQWGAVVSLNPVANSRTCWYQQDTLVPMQRALMWESLYMYNSLDGKLYPLLADGAHTENGRTFTVKIKKAAKWSDGTPLTAKDIEFTFNMHNKYNTPVGVTMWQYLESVKATDDYTVELVGKADNFNPLIIRDMLTKYPMMPKHAFEALEKKHNGNVDDIKADPWWEAIGSGPYKMFIENPQQSVLIRDDNYWGKDPSMWGKLPVPKYIAHNIFADNNAGSVAFQAGEVDVAQQFMSEVWTMWERGLPVSTYIDEEPYYEGLRIPSIWFNVNKPGLDQAAVRRAIAMAIDYGQIKITAMSNYTYSMEDMPPCLMNPTAPERALIDANQLKQYQWSGKQIEEAKAVLDKAGIVDKDGDGYREYNGKKIEARVECPQGWTDWEASLQVVAQAGQAIGLDVTTYFPQYSVYFQDMSTANFDIVMFAADGTGAANPWTRHRQHMYSEHGNIAKLEFAPYNFGRYQNTRVDEIIDRIPMVTDQAELKKLYTELNIIFLRDVPSVPLMYRPQNFHTVNESVWTNFPSKGDGTSIPPMNCTDGYAIASLYNLKLVNP